MPNKPIVFFVDVDDTFVRSYGHKRIPIPTTIEHLQQLHEQGAELYCWSSGGAEYARDSAAEFGIDSIFKDFLPKPNVVIDDIALGDWRNCIQIHPNTCGNKNLSEYLAELRK
ncbi:MAG: hypothetical protein AAF614_30930 [Chloroflexota bacterium]